MIIVKNLKDVATVINAARHADATKEAPFVVRSYDRYDWSNPHTYAGSEEIHRLFFDGSNWKLRVDHFPDFTLTEKEAIAWIWKSRKMINEYTRRHNNEHDFIDYYRAAFERKGETR
jgi:hypothetical protein